MLVPPHQKKPSHLLVFLTQMYLLHTKREETACRGGRSGAKAWTGAPDDVKSRGITFGSTERWRWPTGGTSGNGGAAGAEALGLAQV